VPARLASTNLPPWTTAANTGKRKNSPPPYADAVPGKRARKPRRQRPEPPPLRHDAPPRTTSHPDSHRRSWSFTRSTSYWRQPGRGLSPPVRNCTDPGAREHSARIMPSHRPDCQHQGRGRRPLEPRSIPATAPRPRSSCHCRAIIQGDLRSSGLTTPRATAIGAPLRVCSAPSGRECC
jgi:hypothetical protein